MVLQIKTKPFTSLANEAEETIQAAEGNLAEYIIATQGYFREQENDYTSYFVKHLKELSKVKPINPDNLIGDERPENKKLRDFVDSYNWRKHEDDLKAILKYINHNTIFYGITNAITLINRVAKIKETKEKIDITEVVEYANSPRFAVDAQEYIRSNYDTFLKETAQISKNIDSHTSALIYDELYKGVENLESMHDLAVRIADVFDGCTQNRALTIARTETMRSFNNSTIDAYKTAQIEQAQLLITNDERTCDECSSLSGLVLPVDESRGYLPIHPKCRCTWIAVIGKPLLEEPILEREHLSPINLVGDKTQRIIDDAAKKGITLSQDEAWNIKFKGADKFCGNMDCTDIRTFQQLENDLGGKLTFEDWAKSVGRSLDESARIDYNILKSGDEMIEKFIEITPNFKNEQGLFRGIGQLDEAAQQVIKNTQVGDFINMNNGTSSWSSSMMHGSKFAKDGGTMYIIEGKVPGSASVSYLSQSYREFEVLVSKDVKFKVTKVMENVNLFDTVEYQARMTNLVNFKDDALYAIQFDPGAIIPQAAINEGRLDFTAMLEMCTNNQRIKVIYLKAVE